MTIQKKTFFEMPMVVLDALAKRLNFSIQVIEPTDLEWGSEKNGSWSGLIGQLQKREVDMVAAALSMTGDREAVMDYLLPPFANAHYRVMYREPDVDQYRWLMLLKPFQQMVFLVLGLCVACILLIYGIAELPQRHGTVQRKAEVMSNISWFILGSMLKQGSTNTFTSVSVKVLTFFWWIFLLVITSVYTAKLVAFLSVKKSEPPPFTNLQELSGRLDYTIGFPVEGYVRTYFQNSTRDDMKRIWKRVQKQNQTDPQVLSTNNSYHVSQIQKGKHTAIVFDIATEAYMAKDYRLAYLQDWLLNDPIAFGLPASSPLKSELERGMQMLVDTGLIQKWMQEYGLMSKKGGCRSDKLVKPATLEDFEGSVAAAAVGAGLALLALAGECLYHLHIRSRNGNDT